MVTFAWPWLLVALAVVPLAVGRSASARNVLHNEWGLSLYLESQRAEEQRTILLDFGYTSPAIIN